MSGGYVLIAGILLYIFLLQKADSFNYSPLRLAAVFVVAYYTLYSVVMGLIYYSWNIPILSNLMSIPLVMTALLQFVTALFIFYNAIENSDDYMSYLLVGGLGIALIFFVIPQVIRQLLMATL